MDLEGISTILLATDFSEACRLAERRARELAQRFGASLVVVHGIEPIMGVDADDVDELDEFYRTLLDRAEEQMERRLARYAEANLLVKQHIRIGPRWRVVLEIADEEGVDVIVIGRRAASEGDAPVGTTSEKVFLGSARPVLFVPVES